MKYAQDNHKLDHKSSFSKFKAIQIGSRLFFLPQCYDLHVSYGESKTKTNKQKTKITNKKLKSTNILRLMYTPLRGQKINEEIGEKKNKIYIYMFIYSYKQKTKCDCIRPMKQRKSVRVKIITNGCLK